MNTPDLHRFATTSGARLGPDGQLVHYTEGETWYTSDPFVQANPELFAREPNKVRGVYTPLPAGERVERATRRPGERR
jgi:hypothetical protein